MEALDLNNMTDITFTNISYGEYLHREFSVLIREEVEGIQVGLIHETKADESQENTYSHRYKVCVICDNKELYCEYYPDDWKTSYKAYKEQVRFVRKMFAQSGRKEIFYYRDRDNNIVSVVYA